MKTLREMLKIKIAVNFIKIYVMNVFYYKKTLREILKVKIYNI